MSECDDIEEGKDPVVEDNKSPRSRLAEVGNESNDDKKNVEDDDDDDDDEEGDGDNDDDDESNVDNLASSSNLEKISLIIIEEDAVANHSKSNIDNDNKKTSILGTPYQYEKTKKNVKELLEYINARANETPSTVSTSRNNSIIIKYVSTGVQKDKSVVLECVKHDGMLLEYASLDLKKDTQVVEAAINQNPQALQFVSKYKHTTQVKLKIKLGDGKSSSGMSVILDGKYLPLEDEMDNVKVKIARKDRRRFVENEYKHLTNLMDKESIHFVKCYDLIHPSSYVFFDDSMKEFSSCNRNENFKDFVYALVLEKGVETLEEYLRMNREFMDDFQKLDIGRALVSIVEEAHESNIVLMDFKETNVMKFSSKFSSRSSIWKGIDLDSALEVDTPLHDYVDELAITPDYRAPELSNSNSWKGMSAKKSMDIWSLGIVMLKLFKENILAKKQISWKELSKKTQNELDAILRDVFDLEKKATAIDVSETELASGGRILEESNNKLKPDSDTIVSNFVFKCLKIDPEERSFSFIEQTQDSVQASIVKQTAADKIRKLWIQNSKKPDGKEKEIYQEKKTYKEEKNYQSWYRGIVLKCVKRDGNLLQHASTELQNDQQIVEAAITQCPDAFKYASEDIKNNTALVLSFIKSGGNRIKTTEQPTSKKEEKIAIVPPIKQKDLRSLDLNQNPRSDPYIESRKNGVLFCYESLRLIVMKDRLICMKESTGKDSQEIMKMLKYSKKYLWKNVHEKLEKDLKEEQIKAIISKANFARIENRYYKNIDCNPICGTYEGGSQVAITKYAVKVKLVLRAAGNFFECNETVLKDLLGSISIFKIICLFLTKMENESPLKTGKEFSKWLIGKEKEKVKKWYSKLDQNTALESLLILSSDTSIKFNKKEVDENDTLTECLNKTEIMGGGPLLLEFDFDLDEFVDRWKIRLDFKLDGLVEFIENKIDKEYIFFFYLRKDDSVEKLKKMIYKRFGINVADQRLLWETEKGQKVELLNYYRFRNYATGRNNREWDRIKADEQGFYKITLTYPLPDSFELIAYRSICLTLVETFLPTVDIQADVDDGDKATSVAKTVSKEAISTGEAGGTTPASLVNAAAGMTASLCGVNPVRISGITGPSSCLNGVYEPTKDICGGATVYRLRGDVGIWLRYGIGDKKQWNIVPLASSEKNPFALACIDADPMCLPENIPSSSVWQLYNGSKFNSGVTASLCGVNPVRISGITGPNDKLNGVYEPTEEVCGGVTNYRMRGDLGMWLEHHGGDKKRWTIKSTADKGNEKTCCVYVEVDPMCLPENIPSSSVWRLYDGGNLNSGVIASLCGVNPVRISGITGSKSNLNGVYEPTKGVHSGVTVYEMKGDVGIWLEYNGRGTKRWMVKSTADKGKDKCYIYVEVESMCLPENIPPSSTWQGCDGSDFDTVDRVTISARVYPLLQSLKTIVGDIEKKVKGSAEAGAVQIDLSVDTIEEIEMVRAQVKYCIEKLNKLQEHVHKVTNTSDDSSILENFYLSKNVTYESGIYAEIEDSVIEGIEHGFETFDIKLSNGIIEFSELITKLDNLEKRFRTVTDLQRLKIDKLTLEMTVIAIVLSVGAVVTGAFGMNLDNSQLFGTTRNFFYILLGVLAGFCILVGALSWLDIKNKIFKTLTLNRSSNKQKNE